MTASVSPLPVATSDAAHTLPLWLPREDYAAVERIAREQRVPVTDIVRALVRRGLDGAA